MKAFRRLVGFSLVVIALLAFALWLAPARWLTDTIETRSQGRLQFFEVSGNWWQGQARVGLASAKTDPVMLPGALSWRLVSANVFSRAATFEVRNERLSDKPLQVGLAALANGLRLELGAWDAQLPIAALQGLGAPWNTLGLEGALLWRAGPITLEWSREKSGLLAGARGRLLLPDVSSLVSPVKPLGSYAIEWLSNPAELAFTISTDRGPLLIDAQGALVGNQVRLSGKARAEKESLPALANLLNIIGRRQDTNPAESGQVLIQFG